MKVLDLFSGLGGWAKPFAERGHQVTTLDFDPRFGTDIVADVLEWWPTEPYDIILASPPCEKFSVLALGRNWLPGYVPRHQATRTAIEIVERTVAIIEYAQPAFYLVENPVGMLRKLNLVPYERQMVSYCTYGAPYRKPTDLWGGFPPSLTLRRPCRNGQLCHIASPRGSRHGIQSDTANKHPRVIEWQSALGYPDVASSEERAAVRSLIPPELSLQVCIAAERDLAAGLRAPNYSGRLFA